MRLKIDWASFIVGSKFTVFALFYFVFEAFFQLYKPPGAYIWRGDLTEGFMRYRFVGLIHGGAYFQNFTVFFLYSNLKVLDKQNYVILFTPKPRCGKIKKRIAPI